MNRCFAAIIVIFFLLTAAHAGEIMSKIIFRQEGPDVSPGSFAAKPKTLYLYGKEAGRVEEAPDPGRELTGVMIANGKDAWMINLWNNTGRNFIDSGPTHNFYAPIVPATKPNSPPPVRDFQIGHEISFMKNHHIHAQKVTRDGSSSDFYEAKVEGYTLQVYLDNNTRSVPTESDVLKDGKLIVRLIYEEYDPSIPLDPALFQPPAGVTISEAKS
jgi:hypothetical protein